MYWVAGGLLVCAAVLKSIGLINEPTDAMISPLGRWIVPVQISAEFGVGLLILSGLYLRMLRWATVLVFAGFAGYALYLALSGTASCGCFGPLQIHPWWTFSLDLAVVAGLMNSSLRSWRQSNAELDSGYAPFLSSLPVRRYVVFAVVGICVVSAAVLVRHVDRRTATAKDVGGTSGGLVILEPEKWVGKGLPIADFIDVDVSQGKWVLLLHRHDCPACREAIPHYEELARSGESVALVEVPPYGEFEAREGAYRHGRLKDEREWFVQTPVEIQLNEGLVTAVDDHGR